MFDPRRTSCDGPAVKADWLEDLVWQDVRAFLANPAELLARVREQATEDDSGDLEERHASLTNRLVAQHREKSRYVKLYGQGHIDEDELEIYLADLKNQTENAKLLIASVEADLARKQEQALAAHSTEAWFVALRKNLQDVERDGQQAAQDRRELLKLLVEKIVAGRYEVGRTKVDITYRECRSRSKRSKRARSSPGTLIRQPLSRTQVWTCSLSSLSLFALQTE